LGKANVTGDPNDIMAVQEMPRPAAAVNTEWTSKLGLASHDKQVAGVLSDGVHPGNAFQQPLVVCQNHGPALKAWELMTKCMQEENEAGRNRFLRPDLARKDGKQAASRQGGAIVLVEVEELCCAFLSAEKCMFCAS
jgi:hypothetical protein